MSNPPWNEEDLTTAMTGLAKTKHYREQNKMNLQQELAALRARIDELEAQAKTEEAEQQLYAMRSAFYSVRCGGAGGQTTDACYQRENAPELAAYSAMLELLRQNKRLRTELGAAKGRLKSYNNLLVELADALDVAPYHLTTANAVKKIRRLQHIESAARNLTNVKGRHHSEQAMNQLFEALK